MVSRSTKRAVLIAAALAALMPAAAVAQNDAEAIADEKSGAAEREDDGFPWGVLGLLGLAGLTALRNKDGDIHVDARRNTRS